jgi:hypothetical protein
VQENPNYRGTVVALIIVIIVCDLVWGIEWYFVEQ